MPGRVASTTAARSSRRGASTRATKSTRQVSSESEIPDEGADNSLRRAICLIFADAQKSTAGHRKAIISLRKVQEACCYEPINQNKGKRDEEFDEDDFNNETLRCVLRILPVKKTESVGDRVVRFLGSFLNAATTQDNEIAQSDEENEAVGTLETPTSRLTSHILSTLLPLLQAKEKTIRFRATQITSHIINSLDTIDDNLFHQLRHALLRRIHDKEAPVRLQAVYGLGRLATEIDGDDEREDSDSDDESAGVLQKLLVVLQHDPSAEVRRNLLLNLPLTKEVLPYILERARDADATTRRALYARLLPALGDFRHLGLTHREKVLRWGLRDRDESVRKATAKLFAERWIENCAALPAEPTDDAAEGENAARGPNGIAPPSLDALLELLERIDVVNSGVEGGVALTAMQEFWQSRPDYVQYVSFPDTFWEDLSPELAFVARTFNAYCKSAGLETIIEEKLPEVTKFGFLLEREIERLLPLAVQVATEETDDDVQEDLAHREFVVEQMLHVALTFDYSDEVGRRKISVLMREVLAKADLPEEVTRLAVENLRLTCGEDARGESHFCGIIVEVLAEIHDTIMNDDDEGEGADNSNADESFHSATSHFEDALGDTVVAAHNQARKRKVKPQPMSDEEAEQYRIREIMVNMKCLHVALCMLQNVQCDLAENVHLVAMVENLVVPAARSREVMIRERGILCLGLCSLLSKKLAGDNMDLFLQCFKRGHAELQIIAMQIIGDLVITHPQLFTETTPDSSNAESETGAVDLHKQILKVFKTAIKSSEMTMQSTAAIALAKAMLSRIITDEALLQQLVIAYFDHDTAGNHQLRQSLTYFFPVYCHSSAENALRMVGTTCGTISKLFTLKDALEDDDAEAETAEAGELMVNISQVGNMLLDWTDPRKIVQSLNTAHALDAEGLHLQLAEHILERLVTTNVSNKSEKKILLSMLGKLYLPPTSSMQTLSTVLQLLQEAIETKVAVDKTSTDILKRLQTNLLDLIREAATAERGGEETVLEQTGLSPAGSAQSEVVNQHTEDSANEDGEGSDVTQLKREMEDATLDGSDVTLTHASPDAEGTQFLGEVDEDSEMMDIDG